MFKKEKGKVESIIIDTLIGSNTQIEGNLMSEKDVRVEGEFRGDIHSQGKIIIGEQAKIIGNIYSYHTVVYGKVEGNISGEGLLEIMEKGELYGDIRVKSIAIRQGGIFEGQSNMLRREEEL